MENLQAGLFAAGCWTGFRHCPSKIDLGGPWLGIVERSAHAIHSLRLEKASGHLRSPTALESKMLGLLTVCARWAAAPKDIRMGATATLATP